MQFFYRQAKWLKKNLDVKSKNEVTNLLTLWTAFEAAVV
jgi:hypothetical protein